MCNVSEEEMLCGRMGDRNKEQKLRLPAPPLSTYFRHTPLSRITLRIHQLIIDFDLLMCVRKECCAGEWVCEAWIENVLLQCFVPLHRFLHIVTTTMSTICHCI